MINNVEKENIPADTGGPVLPGNGMIWLIIWIILNIRITLVICILHDYNVRKNLECKALSILQNQRWVVQTSHKTIGVSE